jgi:voltage-gated potassium channel
MPQQVALDATYGLRDRRVNDRFLVGLAFLTLIAADADALTRFDQRMAFPLILSAVVPLFLLPGGAYAILAAVVFIAAWLVFLLDLVVHERRLVDYLGTWLGRFDLLVVVLTAPWFLVVGPTDSKFLLLIRLARLSRVVMATRGARRLFERLGRVALVAVAVVIVGAAVAYRAEHATNPGFATYGDALWWAIVTLTTVGYGDIVPKSTAGRVDSVMIMITGISILGLLAGSMASFFHLDSTTPTGAPEEVADDAQSRDALASEVSELRTQIARLVEEMARVVPREPDPPDTPR